MLPYATLGLAARKALPGSRAARRDIDSSTRGMDGCTFLSFQATPNAPQRQGRLVVLPPGNPAAGFSCFTARAALGAAKAPVR
jgi:hypothetical protein